MHLEALAAWARADSAATLSPEHPVNRALAEACAGTVARLLHADGAIVYLMDPNGETLRWVADAGISNSPERSWMRSMVVPLGVGMFGSALADRSVRITDDYQNDKTLDDGDLLYSGALALPHDFWAKHGKTVESWQSGSHTFYRISGPIVPSLLINQFVYFEAPGEPSLYARVTEIRGKTAVLKTLKDFGHLKNAVWGVTTRNREQNFAMNLLMDPEVDFVTLTGTAGTGKTLMALAAGLT